MTKKFLSTFASSAGPDVNIARNEHQKNARQPKGYLDETTNREDRPEAKGVPDAEQVEGGEVEVQDRPQYVEGCIVKLEATEPLSKTAKVRVLNLFSFSISVCRAKLLKECNERSEIDHQNRHLVNPALVVICRQPYEKFRVSLTLTLWKTTRLCF